MSSFHESLPLYTARPSDIEVASMISEEAPSYTSEAPSYHSEVTGFTTHRSLIHTSTQTSTTSTSDRRQPPSSSSNSRGTWRSARSQLSSGLDVRTYSSIPTWSNVRSHQEKTLRSVAHRRANAAAAAAAAAGAGISSPATKGAAALRVRRPPPPLPPTNCEVILEEDPYLVGTEAADQARRERRLTTKQCEDAEALLQEAKAWDFFIGQTADWEVREKNWRNFREQMQKKPGFFRRRLAVLGTGKW
ncbi:MAG: hypothetical protein M1816_000059 [Peltula sp. TS41687]|nr:MAG: hypothetical protein M1816_000059 [Peltula sp. TS41687]